MIPSNNTKQSTSLSKNEINVKQSSPWFPFLVFFAGTFVFAALTYFGAYNRFFNFNKSQIPFALSYSIIIIVTAILFVAIADSVYMMWRVASRDEKYSSRTEKNLDCNCRINIIFYYINLFLFMFWPLFFYCLALPIVSVCILGVSILLSIFLVYRFFCDSIVSGILFTLWTLWEIYLFVLNFAYLFIK